MERGAKQGGEALPSTGDAQAPARQRVGLRMPLARCRPGPSSGKRRRWILPRDWRCCHHRSARFRSAGGAHDRARRRRRPGFVAVAEVAVEDSRHRRGRRWRGRQRWRPAPARCKALSGELGPATVGQSSTGLPRCQRRLAKWIGPGRVWPCRAGRRPRRRRGGERRHGGRGPRRRCDRRGRDQFLWRGAHPERRSERPVLSPKLARHCARGRAPM